MFLSLLIKVDVINNSASSHQVFEVLLVIWNVVMIVAAVARDGLASRTDHIQDLLPASVQIRRKVSQIFCRHLPSIAPMFDTRFGCTGQSV